MPQSVAANLNTRMKEEFWKNWGTCLSRFQRTKGCLYVLADANARTRKRIEGCGDGSVLGASGRDELNSNGTHLLAFGSDNKLAFTNTFFAFIRQVEYIIRSRAYDQPPRRPKTD